ncbi:MAG: LLM class flavin-dependent oxidoreductase [Pseudomonadota bacterium]
MTNSGVNFGLWYDFRNPAQWRRPFETLYSESLEQIAWAEGLGFDSVWLTEHHFCDDGYCPAPLVIAAAIGARTQRIRIATNLMLLPLHHPLRVAEEAALVSLTCGGRFDLGVGAGYVESEYRAFGRSLKNRPSLMEEGIAIIRSAWTGERIHFEGKRYTIDSIEVRPTPEQPIKILMGATSGPAVARAARISDGFLSSGGIGQDTYLQATAELDERPGNNAIFAGCWGIVAEDPEQARNDLAPHLLYQTNGYIEMGAFGSGTEAPVFERAEDAINNGFYQFWTPEEAVTQILEHLNAYPQIKDMHFWAQFPGESIVSGNRRIELLASRVLPEVRKALLQQHGD